MQLSNQTDAPSAAALPLGRGASLGSSLVPDRTLVHQDRLFGRLRVLCIVLLLVALASGFLAIMVSQRAVAPLDFPVSTRVLDRNDRLLRLFTVADGRWRLDATPEAVDPRFIELLLTFEDRRFWDHPGVDARALVRAALQWVIHGRIVSGGSTLTMQVVRLMEGADTRSLSGKWHQIIGALALERHYDKREILAAYLTLAPYGGNIEGVRTASLAWLGKEPRRLTPAEAALLVALPQSPETRRPDRHAEAARRARDRVLERAYRAGVLDEATYQAALVEPLPRHRHPYPRLAAHAAEQWVAREPSTIVHRTTIDAGLQLRLERLAQTRAVSLGPSISVALVVAEHASGAIRAVVGSADYIDRQRQGYVDMTRASRSPGSTLKPLIYGLAFEAGIAHPESLIEDRPTSFAGYTPRNFDGAYQGTVTLRRALRLSLNVPAVQLLDAVGAPRLIARIRRAGVDPAVSDRAPLGLAIGLGGVGLSLRDLTQIYAAIARGGRSVALFERSVDASPESRRVLDERAAWYLASILAGAPTPTGRAAHDIAFKTGTSYGYRDAWAIGFDGRHVVGVWVGRPDAAAVSGLIGIDSAAPLLFDAFARIGPPTPLPGPPPGVLTARSDELPPPLRRVRTPRGANGPSAPPEIAFPPAEAHVALDASATGEASLALKVRNGRPPFVWLVNGTPVARHRFDREARWIPEGPGYTSIAVVDGAGRSSRVRVYIE